MARRRPKAAAKAKSPIDADVEDGPSTVPSVRDGENPAEVAELAGAPPAEDEPSEQPEAAEPSVPEPPQDDEPELEDDAPTLSLKVGAEPIDFIDTDGKPRRAEPGEDITGRMQEEAASKALDKGLVELLP